LGWRVCRSRRDDEIERVRTDRPHTVHVEHRPHEFADRDLPVLRARFGRVLTKVVDIDFDAGTLTVVRNDWRGHIGSPKSGKDREIPLTARAAAALRAIRHLKSRLVFCRDDGSRWTLTTMRAGIARQEKRAGLRRTGWHVLRHSFCSHLAGRGVAAVVIKKLAGHSPIAVTNRYMHESEGDLREAISRLGGDGVARTA
jgi:integrase